MTEAGTSSALNAVKYNGQLADLYNFYSISGKIKVSLNIFHWSEDKNPHKKNIYQFCRNVPLSLAYSEHLHLVQNTEILLEKSYFIFLPRCSFSVAIRTSFYFLIAVQSLVI
jgi:hypothetical protein